MRFVVGSILIALIAFIAGAALAAPAPAAQKPSVYTDTTYGFTINAPEWGKGNSTAFPLIMNAPPANGFARNLNVGVEPIKTTLNEYLDQTITQLKQRDAKILSQKEIKVSGKPAELLEWEGAPTGRMCHFLQLLVIDTDQVYILTCTCLPDDFAAHQAEFQKSLDSFALIEK